ncbi:cyclase family protein [Wandonia haliotis]|uniref:Cyclase family protein n=1 Tax=Wandonia haliotis TaxID=574963 RepID=A0ABN1MM39_9FLAO
MRLRISHNEYIETSEGIDLSIELTNKTHNPRAWYVDLPEFEPVRANGFTGSVAEGGSVNFRNIAFNPHGHGTHTECLGHISREVESINTHLKEFWFTAQVITVTPRKRHHPDEGVEDNVITLDQIQKSAEIHAEAIIIRTLPNPESKKSAIYSGTNPPYFDAEIADYLVSRGVKHLLVDLPSVDREVDAGVLDFHHRFWCYPNTPRFDATITELIYVPETVNDGIYMLNLQVAAFDNDAAPSRPVLFTIQKGS